MKGSSSWAGIPELKAMSEIYGIEMAVVIIFDVEILMFNHNKGLKKRAYFIYNGTHYNLCVAHPSGGQIKRLFDPKDEEAFQGVMEYTKKCKARGEGQDPAKIIKAMGIM